MILNELKLIDLSDSQNLIEIPDLSGGAYLGHEFFLIPGSEIPKLFSHQSVENSLNLQGPLDFVGIVVCAPPWGFIHYLHFFYNVMGSEIFDSHGIIFYEQSSKIGSSHIWLKYFPFEHFQGKSGNELSQIDANGFSQIETKGPGLEVTKCGAHLVYNQDIEDLKQTTAGSSRCSITPYEDDLDDSAKDTKIKCNHDDFDGDETGPSGEATNREVGIPQSKRIRLLNLIERFIPHLGNWIGNSSTQEDRRDNLLVDLAISHLALQRILRLKKCLRFNIPLMEGHLWFELLPQRRGGRGVVRK
nr:hypothetical protein CFP56_22057 [Quercus suber]